MFTKKFQLITSIINIIALALLALYGLSSSAWAQQGLPSLWGESTVPLVMNYQGHVEDSEGNPLTDYYTMTFRIYDDVVATTALWEEEHPSVTVREGYFDVLLGNTTPISDTLFNQPDRFIGVTVHPHDEMVPRQRFASVPYAVHSYHATEADHALEADHADQADQADHATQADHAYALNAPDGDPADAVYVDDEGQVGIGTTSPVGKLDVNGSICISGDCRTAWTGPAEIVQQQVTAWRFPNITVNCPAGKYVRGGGAHCSSPIGWTFLAANRPNGNGWYAGCDTPQNTNATITVYALCE